MKTLLSGIQPSGTFTIGNYIGAINNWLNPGEDFRTFIFIADLHALTAGPEPAALRQNTLASAAMLLACGVNPEAQTLYVQSHVPAHSELAWILNCYTMFGEAKRMTQFKDKSARRPDNINVGLFSYPVLQAADILLLQSDLVPVGADQKQHLELARDLAVRFNNRYSPTFKVPEAFIPAYGGRIMSLADPSVKMSKSDENPNAYIALTDTDDEIRRKFKRAVTDSGGTVKYCKEQPGISNLLTIYAAFKGRAPHEAKGKIADAEKECAGMSYAAFKDSVAEAVISVVRPIRAKYEKLLKDKEYLNAALQKGAQTAAYEARKTLDKVKRKVGLYS